MILYETPPSPGLPAPEIAPDAPPQATATLLPTKRPFVPPSLVKQGTVAALTAGFGGSVIFP